MPTGKPMRAASRSLLTQVQVFIILISMAIIFAVAGVSLYIVSRSMRADLTARATDTANEMQAFLEYPLYAVDNDQAVRIAKTFLTSSRISGIILESAADGLLLSETRGLDSPRIPRISRNIHRDGLYLGKFTITFSDAEIQIIQRRFGMISLVIVIAVLLVNLATNRFIIVRRVRQAFLPIVSAIQNITDGNYQTLIEPSPYRDINILVSLFNHMAGEIHLKNQTQKSVETALRESERKFRAIFNQTFQLIGLLTPEGRMLGSNHASLTFAGIAEKDILNAFFWNTPWWADSPENRERLREAIERAAAGQFVRMEVTLPDAAGEPHFFDFSIKPVFDENGQVVMLIPEGRDISERKRMEEAQSARLQRIQRQQSALIGLAKNPAVTQGDLDGAAAFIVETGSEVIGVERTGIWFLDGDRTELRCIDLFDRGPGAHQSGTVLAVRDYPRYFAALSMERAIAAQDAQTDERTREFTRDYLSPLRITSMLDATVRLRGNLIGVICFEHIGQPRTWHEDEIVFAASCADYVAATLTQRERAQAEHCLRESERKARAVFDLSFGFLGLLTSGGLIVEINRTALDFAGASLADVAGRPFWETPFWTHSPEMQQRLRQAIQTAASGELARFEATNRGKDGNIHTIDFSIKPVMDDAGRVVLLILEGRDITSRKQAEEEKESLQNRLLQAQKMEAIGQLTGGIAHDFNNMLGVVIGQAEMAMKHLDPGDRLYARLNVIHQAADRTADLVRQLLAFARQQTTSPKVLDLNETISGMLKILRRIIGEDIELAWVPGPDVKRVKIDPSQLDQILANLTVNARDAIAGIGKITIETHNVEIDESYCSVNPGLSPGDYVMIAFSDTGSGMDAHTLSQIFEPFFTTKPVGKGTGLGLSTVYGIIQQNQGHITVYSEPGKGTTFKIYLTRIQGDADETSAFKTLKSAPSGTETVLIVEDDEMILDLADSILDELGYRVLTAGTPAEAIALVQKNPETLHLLITDVVMPQMNGKDLAARLLKARPGLKCLFMSGYTADVIAHHGVLEEGVRFIQKPFALTALALKVREVLDAPSPSA